MFLCFVLLLPFRVSGLGFPARVTNVSGNHLGVVLLVLKIVPLLWRSRITGSATNVP